MKSFIHNIVTKHLIPAHLLPEIAVSIADWLSYTSGQFFCLVQTASDDSDKVIRDMGRAFARKLERRRAELLSIKSSVHSAVDMLRKESQETATIPMILFFGRSVTRPVRIYTLLFACSTTTECSVASYEYVRVICRHLMLYAAGVDTDPYKLHVCIPAGKETLDAVYVDSDLGEAGSKGVQLSLTLAVGPMLGESHGPSRLKLISALKGFALYPEEDS